MKRLVAVVVVVLLVASSPNYPQPVEDAERDTYFISDLHLGLGRMADGSWHPMEDFRWHDEFDAFLRYTTESTGRPADLVILGDFLELWQSDVKDCQSSGEKDLGCSVEEVTKRTRRVVAAHPAVFESLAAFIRRGENTVIIVPGNHDAALLRPEPREVVISAFPEDVRDRVAVLDNAIWTSKDGQVAAEHGQQIGDDPNKYVGWPSPPIRRKAGVDYIVQPLGEIFVQHIFNKVESDYPIIDNFSGRLDAFAYYRASTNWKNELKDMAKVIRFLATQQTASQFRQLLRADGTQEASWDIAKTKERLGTDQDRWEFLISSLPDAEMRRELAPEPAPNIDPFSDEDIRMVCDLALSISTCPGDVLCHCVSVEPPRLKAIGESAAIAMSREHENKIIAAYLSDLVRTRLEGRPLRFYIYGHTHEAKYFKPSATTTVYNDGAWQRTISVADLEKLRSARGWSKSELLRNARPEDLPACYPFVHMRPLSGQVQPEPVLRHWNYRESDGKTCASDVCNLGFLSGERC